MINQQNIPNTITDKSSSSLLKTENNNYSDNKRIGKIPPHKNLTIAYFGLKYKPNYFKGIYD